MKKILFFLSALIIISAVHAQTTIIPDSNFEQALINLGYDDYLDGSVVTANISSITFLDVQNLSISNLMGIEDFSSLTTLYCDGNLLSSLDLSNNISLVDLGCSNNQLVSLDLTNNVNLDAVNCSNNSILYILGLDFSNCTYLNCSLNQLTSLTVQEGQLTQLICNNNPNLIEIFCYNNQITNLDISNLLSLEQLICWNNQISNLDLSNHSNLTMLQCGGNLLTTLDVSNNLLLENIDCRQNQLSSLDLSNHTALTSLQCFDNNLTNLDLRNGNNSNMTAFNATQNPSLSCIDVDDVTWSTANWSSSIDPQTIFSTDCSTVGLSDISVSDISAYPNPTQGNFTIDFGGITTEVKATFINNLGQIIFTQQYTTTSPITMNIDTPRGIYFLDLAIVNGEQTTIKVVKQ